MILAGLLPKSGVVPFCPAHLTEVALAVGDGGATDQQGAAQNTWAQFSQAGTAPGNITNWEGEPLRYYESGTTFAYCSTTVDGLLSTGNGRCGTHALLLARTMAVNGIESEGIGVNVDQPSGSVRLMLVKAWEFNPSPTFPAEPRLKWRMVLPDGGSPNEMVAGGGGPIFGDLTSTLGAAGQNSATPSQKLFGDHAIVKLNIPGPLGDVCVDPSYGLQYSDLADFELKAIDGFAELEGIDAIGSYVYRVRKTDAATAGDDLSFAGGGTNPCAP